MKNIILLTFLLVLTLANSADGQVQLNVSTGINQSTVEVTDLDGVNLKSRTGYFIGLAPNFSLKENLSLSVDVQYSQKGYTETNFPPSTELRISYLDIIPEIEFKVVNFLALGIGGNYGLRIGEAFNAGNGGWNKTENLKLSNSSDFGLTGKIKASFNHIFAFFRYNHGLKNITDSEFTDANGNIIDGPKLQNRNFQVGVGYTLGLKKK